jgi:hypothetical protein
MKVPVFVRHFNPSQKQYLTVLDNQNIIEYLFQEEERI